MNPGHESQRLADCILASAAGCSSVIEFGCGLGRNLIALGETSCKENRVGVDAYRNYLIRVPPFHLSGISLIEADALTAAGWMKAESFDLVLMADFIEHLERPAAEQMIAEAKRIARRRIVAFVPEGEHPQTADATGLHGDHWQTHRSTWGIEDLQRLGFDVAHWPQFHAKEGGGKSPGAMFAIWESQK